MVDDGAEAAEPAAAGSDEGPLFSEVVDFVLPVLAPYDFALYVLLLRRSHVAHGKPTVTIGKRSIAAALGKGTRSSRGNYQHITEKLENLQAAGFLAIHETDRRGTTYSVALPQDVPAVRELMEQAADLVSDAPPDFYTDPVRRTELHDRDGYRCRYCGQLVTDETCTLDHIVPRSKGGPNTAENLATCCLMCNAIKSGRTYA